MIDHKKDIDIASLKTIDLLLLAESKGISFFLEGDNLKFRLANGKELDQNFLAQIKDRKSEIKNYYLNNEIN